MNRLLMLMLLLLLTVPALQLAALNPPVEKGFPDQREELFSLDTYQGAAAREHEHTITRVPVSTGKIWYPFRSPHLETGCMEHSHRQWIWFISPVLRRFLPVPAIHSP
ncbi:MAG: hypothetical protein ACOYXB_17160 [Bacteroidota bacterium]